jgi:hypothetical protein
MRQKSAYLLKILRALGTKAHLLIPLLPVKLYWTALKFEHLQTVCLLAA